MGGAGPRRVPVMRPPLSMYLFGSSAVSGKGYTSKGNSLAMRLSEARRLSAHHPDKNYDDVRFILVLQCLLAFSWPCRYTLWPIRALSIGGRVCGTVVRQHPNWEIDFDCACVCVACMRAKRSQDTFFAFGFGLCEDVQLSLTSVSAYRSR